MQYMKAMSTEATRKVRHHEGQTDVRNHVIWKSMQCTVMWWSWSWRTAVAEAFKQSLLTTWSAELSASHCQSVCH